MRNLRQIANRATRMLLRTVFPIAAGLIWTPAVPAQSRTAGQPSGGWRPKDTEWASYAADVRGTRYRPLDQIDASNFNKLELAWRFKTDHLGPFPEFKLEGTPLMVNGVIYTTGGTRRAVVALDPRTGEQIWMHSLREGDRGAASPRQLSGRGVAYWTNGNGDERVIYVTTGYGLSNSTPKPVRRSILLAQTALWTLKPAL